LELEVIEQRKLLNIIDQSMRELAEGKLRIIEELRKHGLTTSSK